MSAAERDRIDAEELSRVAMFPLPDVVLLPGALIPLHIFEERYRDMTRDVLEGSGLIALARLLPGHDEAYLGRPPVHPTLGVGRVIESFELPDGRYDILVRGLIRATLVEELPAVHTYREVHLDVLEDRPPSAPAVLDAARQKLIELCDALSEYIERGSAELRALARGPETPGACADLIAAMLIGDTDERQTLLETRDPLQRLERVMQGVSRILGELAPESSPPSTLN